MILVHTLFVLSVIAGSGLVVAVPQSSDTSAKDGANTTLSTISSTAKAEEVITESPKTEPPKDAAKSEGEKKVEAADGARSMAKMLKEGIETSGDKVVSDESLNSAVEKIVDIIHGEKNGNPKAEALPLSLGERFDFLLLKIPKIRDGKKDEDSIRKDTEKPKDDVLSKEQGGARILNDNRPVSAPSNPPCAPNGCNNCPCPQLTQQAPVTSDIPNKLNPFNPPQEYVDPNCAQTQQQQLLQAQQQQLMEAQQLQMMQTQQQQPLQSQQQQFWQTQQQPMYQPSYRPAGASEFESAARGLEVPGAGQNYAQQTYLQPLQNFDFYGYPSNYYNRMPYLQNGLDAFGTPYPYIASLYPEAQRGSNSNWNNNMKVYGNHKH